MDLENMYLTRYLHCPNCNSMYIIMDCEIIACPICNLFRFKKIQEFKRGISTPILNKCNYVHNYYENVKTRILREQF